MKGILFDLDGTLLDSMGVWVRLADDYLLSLGIDPPGDLRQYIKTMTLKEALGYFQERFGITDDVDKMLADTHAILATYYHTSVTVKPAAKEVLQALQANGNRMAVATATVDALSVPAIEHQGLQSYFEFVQTPANSGFTKNEVAFWEEAARRLGMPPEEIVVFEDALHGMETAKAAGMRVIAIADETALRDRDRIRALADVYMEGFSEFNLAMLG